MSCALLGTLELGAGELALSYYSTLNILRLNFRGDKFFYANGAFVPLTPIPNPEPIFSVSCYSPKAFYVLLKSLLVIC